MKKIIENFINENNGYLSIKKLKLIIPYYKIKYYIQKNKDLIKIKKGLYCKNNTKRDFLFEESITNSNLIFSHESALYLQNLITSLPPQWSVSTFQGNNSLIINPNFKVFYVKKDKLFMGVKKIKTHFGNEVLVYDMDKTICDVIKNKKKIDSKIFNEGWNNYIKHNDRKHFKLSEYARELKIMDKLVFYMSISYINY